MKKITLLFSLIFVIVTIHAQNYQISFAGIGASTIVDSVKVENLTQCTDTFIGGGDILHLIADAGIKEFSNGSNNIIHIYPNPTTGNCSVDFEAPAHGNTNLELYDITGKRIVQMHEFLSKGYHVYNLNGINSGIYTLKIESDKYFYTAKIISINAATSKTEIEHFSIIPDTGKQCSASNSGKMKHLNSSKSIIDMQYSMGDTLMLTGKSGIYRTVKMLIPPIQSQTDTFNFVYCADADSNYYAVIQIGTQIWMSENLKTTKYRNGTSIPNVTINTDWGNLFTGAYSDYNNIPANSAIYGRLYNWFAVTDTNYIAPVGWHIPSDGEWTTLTTYLGGTIVTGGKLKESCTIYWTTPNKGANNVTGFSALPGGYRNYAGPFYDIGNYGQWWSSTEYTTSNSWYRYVYYNYSNMISYNSSKKNGFSVRCIKD